MAATSRDSAETERAASAETAPDAGSFEEAAEAAGTITNGRVVTKAAKTASERIEWEDGFMGRVVQVPS